MAEGASFETLPRSVQATILSSLDARDLATFEVAVVDVGISEEASWEALREFASKCVPPAAVSSFTRTAHEPSHIAVDAVRAIVAVFQGEPVYNLTPPQEIPTLDSRFNFEDYMTIGAFVSRDFSAYGLDRLEMRDRIQAKREFNHVDMRAWNAMHADKGGFWTKPPGAYDLACWLVFGVPCEHVTRMYAAQTDETSEYDEHRGLFANIVSKIIQGSAAVFLASVQSVPAALRQQLVPRVLDVALRLQHVGQCELAAKLVFEIAPKCELAVADVSPATAELFIAVAEMTCDAMYASTFVHFFQSETEIEVFTRTVEHARLAVEATTAAVDAKRRAPYRDAFADIQIQQTIRRELTENVDVRGLAWEKQENLVYANDLQRLAAALHVYARLLGLAHQQKHMKPDSGSFPEHEERIFAPTDIWPTWSAAAFHRDILARDMLGNLAAEAAMCIRESLENFHSSQELAHATALARAASAEVTYCRASVKVHNAMRALLAAQGTGEQHVSDGAVTQLFNGFSDCGDACFHFRDAALHLEDACAMRLNTSEQQSAFPSSALYCIAKDLGKTLSFASAHRMVDAIGAKKFMRETLTGDDPWVAWEAMETHGDDARTVRGLRGSSTQTTSQSEWCAHVESEQWLLLAYANAVEMHGPHHADAKNVLRMFAHHETPVTPEVVHARAKKVAAGYRAETIRKRGG